jgi:FAD/FMN-containing dehydrogenase
MDQSVYLLANEKNHFHSLDKYHLLIRKLSAYGEFLTYEKNAEWLACYAQDSQQLKSLLPLLVFRPHEISSLKFFVRACFEEGLPIQVRGGGTALCGASIVSPEGILVLTSHLNGILNYDPENGKVKLEPGVTCHQLNHAVFSDGWEFNLEMATGGVATLAGCLSCNSRGYHQGSRPIYQDVISALLIDGTGEICEVPGSLICGAEGMFGIVVQLEVQLSRIPESRLVLEGDLTWEELIKPLDFLKQCHALKSIGYYHNKCHFRLEGAEWRVRMTIDQIKNLYFPQKINFTQKNCSSLFNNNFSGLVLNCMLPVRHLKVAEDNFQKLAKGLGLKIDFSMELLTGALHLFLFNQMPIYEFKNALEQFMVLGIEWVEKFNGRLFCSQGVGKVWQPYMTPFFGEEDLTFMRDLKAKFDPKRLFCRDHFFPEDGKCLTLAYEEILSKF